jgi:hypothetical protein
MHDSCPTCGGYFLEDSDLRLCPHCERWLSRAAFARHDLGPDGLRSWCKACENGARRKEESSRPARPELPEGKRWCPSCEQALSVEDFGADKSRKDGLRVHCRSCRAAKPRKGEDRTRAERDARRKAALAVDRVTHAERINATRAARRAEARVIKGLAATMVLAAGHKTCRVCEQPKALEDFMPRGNALDGRASTCRSCVTESRRVPDPEDRERAARWAAREEDVERRAEVIRSKRT